MLEGLPPDARIGTWVFEWYWLQPDVPHVKEFVADIRKAGGKVPTARHWFGYVAAWTCALVANEQKTLDPIKLAKALENFKLPPEIALMPYDTFYRAGDHQLDVRRSMSATRSKRGSGPGGSLQGRWSWSKGVDAALPVAETGCHLSWPA